MSRVGNKPIPLPKGVKITIGDQLLVEGPKGKQTVPVPPGITLLQKDGILDSSATVKTRPLCMG